MLFSDYLSQHGIIITLLMVLIGLCMLYLQKHKSTKSAWLICIGFFGASICIFVGVGLVLNSKQVSTHDHIEMTKLLNRFGTHSMQLEAEYKDIDRDISQIRILEAKKNLTYKDLENVNYALTRDRVNKYVFSKITDDLK